MNIEQLTKELHGQQGFAAWVRRKAIPTGKRLAEAARREVIERRWGGHEPGAEQLKGVVNDFFCDLLDTEYELYLRYEQRCFDQAIALALSDKEAQAWFPITAKLLQQAVHAAANQAQSAEDKFKTIAALLRPFYRYRLFEQSLAQGRMGRAGGSAQIHLEYLLKRLGYDGEFETQQVLNGKVDFLFPSRTVWSRDKQRCVIVSVKRSLRERYMQVFEELGITGGLTVYLVITQPADEARKDLTPDKLENIKRQNIYLVVRDAVKQQYFPGEQRVLGFTQFIAQELPLRRQLWRPLMEEAE